MLIALAPESQDALLAWAGKICAAHVEAAVEPDGYTLHVEMGPDRRVWATWGPEILELGTVDVIIR